jgi:hypothetical protein
MVAYTDVPAVNALYMEQEQINQAIMMIDDGGRVLNFTIGPKLPDVSETMPPGVPPYMPVMIVTRDPPDTLMAQARAALVLRQNEIVAELAALGVTEGPVAMAERKRAGR